MSHKYSHLIWLGANTATEPANLLPSAQQATLFEAREAACLALQKQHSESNISVINALVTTTNQTANFTEYNLPEFSACQPATGLTKLFPGLKAVNSESQNGIAISDAINELTLADDNNLLVVDILDSNLTLLKALETSKHLSSFKTIYIQAPQEPLYIGAAGHEEIVAFMQTQGYLPQAITSSDPDLLWLSFIINPLWKTLQQTQQKNLESTKQLQNLEQQISEKKQQLLTINQQKQEVEQQLSATLQELEATKKKYEELTLNMKKNIEEKEQELKGKANRLLELEKQVSELTKSAEEKDKKNLTQIDSEKKLKQKLNEQEYRNNNLNQEVTKLAAQIDLITNVVLKEKAF